jgi:hypothetical protein
MSPWWRELRLTHANPDEGCADDGEAHEGHVVPEADVKSNKSIHYGYSLKSGITVAGLATAADFFARGARYGARHPIDGTQRHGLESPELASRRIVPCREYRLFACRIPDAHSVAAEAP